ncbi:hypothetical protein SAMN05444374_102127 [Rhodococcoides kroppenstedtii]|uniref:Uncharacterized protein n=1 Tax=Rhodococcoides kroppenstedtii TaxID=293050 RepID=A0A1I0SSM3_9NOCA|nr:hypothetical protein [Rhodococcus kroppenstedtii]SFA41766.1 hypothetical protein SAMN05444374_102127 [Rhodococcus kroppenstedtii]
MTLRDRIIALPPERYARSAKSSARLAAKVATDAHQPVPENAARILDMSLEQLAEEHRRRQADEEPEAPSPSSTDPNSPLGLKPEAIANELGLSGVAIQNSRDVIASLWEFALVQHSPNDQPTRVVPAGLLFRNAEPSGDPGDVEPSRSSAT